MKTIEEKNKVIAKFMGYQYAGNMYKAPFHQRNVLDEVTDLFYTSDLQFHKSWDWLMPVIKTIREQVNVDMGFDDYDDWRENFKEIDPYNYSLEQCHEAVFQFIEWYNEQK